MDDEEDKTLKITVNPFQNRIPKGGGSASGVPDITASPDAPGPAAEPSDQPAENAFQRRIPPKGALQGTPQRPSDAPTFGERLWNAISQVPSEAAGVVSQVAEEAVAPGLGWPMDLVAGAPKKAMRAASGALGGAKPPNPPNLLGGSQSILDAMRATGLSAADRRPQTLPGKVIASTAGGAIEAPLFGGPTGLLIQQLGRNLPRVAKFGANLAKPLPNIIAGAGGGAGGELLEQTGLPGGRAIGSLAGGMASAPFGGGGLRRTRAEINAAARTKAGLPAQSAVDDAYEALGLYQTAAEAGVTGPILRAAETGVFPHTVGGGSLTASNKASRDQGLLEAKNTIAAAFGTPSSERLAGEAAQSAMKKAYLGERRALGNVYDQIAAAHATASDVPGNTLHALANPVTSATSPASVAAAKSPALIKLTELIKEQNWNMSVGDLKAQKTEFGKLLEPGAYNAGVDKAQVKQIIGALDDDIRHLVKGRSPADYQKLLDTDKLYFANEDRFRRHIKEAVGTGKKAPSAERVYHIITNSAGTTGDADMAQLKTVWNAMPKAAQGELSATILQRMGALDKTKPLESFSVGQFIKDYRTISEEAKDLLWRNHPQQGKAIKDLETVVSHMEQTLPNYTTGKVGHFNKWGWGMQGAFNTMMFDPMTALVTIGGPAAAQFIMTNPTGVRMLAKSLRAGRAATDAALREFTTIQALPGMSGYVNKPEPKVPADVISMYGAKPGKDEQGNEGHYFPDPSRPGKYLKLSPPT